jgi:hypothetical protein
MAKETQDSEILACEVCLTEIPESVNVSAEADDYVVHYCGLECYRLWLEQQMQPDNSEGS